MATAEPFGGGPAEPDSGLAFTLRYAVPGLIGTAVLAIGALGVGWLPPVGGLADIPLLNTMRFTGIGAFVSHASVILGGAVLLQAWLVLGADVLTGHIRDLRRLWGVLAIWTAPLLLAPPLFSRDVYSYLAQGRLVLAGIDPYTNGVATVPGWFQDGVDPMWQLTPTPYGPVFLAMERGVAALVGDNTYLAVIAFRLLAVAGVALLAYYVPRLAFHCGIDASKAVWLGVLNPLILMHFVLGAHNDALMVGLMVAGLTLAIERRPIIGIALVTMGAMVKPIGLLALPFVGLVWAGTRATTRQRVIAWAKSGVVAVLTYGVFSALVGGGLGWVRALTTPGEVRTWLSPSTALGMFSGNVLSWFGLGDHLDLTVGIFRALGELLAIGIVAYLLLKPQGRTPVQGLAWAFLAVVFLGPVVQPWYLLWILPLVAASGVTPRQLQIVLLVTAAFTFYGLCESSATSDSFFELSDGLAMVAAAAAVGLALSASPRERQLVFGEPTDHGLLPDDAPAAARREMLVVRGPQPA
ncbi:MAG: polyprenol phosphomannose-dependent alpha 1,6 mannosyltransferase MptB [Candidatus Nanopelagicales bacterium]